MSAARQSTRHLMIRLLRRAVASALLAICAAIPLWEYRRANPPDYTFDRIRQTGTLIVGMDPSYPPFADGRQGAPVGLDVDVANEIGHRLGVHVQLRLLGFDGLYDALKVGE